MILAEPAESLNHMIVPNLRVKHYAKDRAIRVTDCLNARI